ncbi:unnamed protein product [Vitrella brassicaformis CCMP3155]|uniref:PSI domain-containing protein n=1 Tax=Vitrella brassicaformis (strain CCMP3155) TaxID=1169540 RepID=A0A0G4EBD2_VITBC|nr:unnamed protein product [Vitrella brassicaformis CCMP3155]|eukprot:CEL93009.1 unnamed protein product [Vitrella brassicaformis CCMP3155]
MKSLSFAVLAMLAAFTMAQRAAAAVDETTPKPAEEEKCCWECHLFDFHCWKNECRWDACTEEWKEEHPEEAALAEQKMEACAHLQNGGSEAYAQLRLGNSAPLSVTRTECEALRMNIEAATRPRDDFGDCCWKCQIWDHDSDCFEDCFWKMWC